MNTIDDFYLRVDVDDETGCWNWTGGVNAYGYGRFRYKGKYWLSHRFVIDVLGGTKLQPKQVVCHKCDNPLCVNPDHLFIGTQKDNLIDMFNKNRNWTPMQKGEKHFKAVLTESDVLSIREEFKRPEHTAITLADKYGVATKTIYGIVEKTRWTHI